jgi:hypothetical protein
VSLGIATRIQNFVMPMSSVGASTVSVIWGFFLYSGLQKTNISVVRNSIYILCRYLFCNIRFFEGHPCRMNFTHAVNTHCMRVNVILTRITDDENFMWGSNLCYMISSILQILIHKIACCSLFSIYLASRINASLSFGSN